jgi:hypothetical protein
VQPRQALTTYLAVFTVDPLIANPDDLAGAPIARTMIGGDVVHRDVAVDW